ncbi:MAG TPA: tetratricopeptide repeat protein [Roseiflexaceae bacterium]|nr:tetratricopeptide repeat protein [Roseiflexaceae bacterium]
MDEPSFGVWLRRRRKALDLTQQALARRVGYSVSAIRKLEADEYRPSHEIAERLADALDVAPQERAAFVRFARHEPDAGAALPALPVPPHPPEAHATNLPRPPTSCIGREGELTLIATYLARADCRLVTVIGPGGIGKTCLALEAAAARVADHPDGVHLVALAALGSSRLLPSTIADTLGLALYGATDPEAQLLHFLRAKRLLLLLDNFEHLLDGAGLLARILDQAPHVKLLVTSRERLNLREEWLLPLQGLHFPKDDQATDVITGYSAVQLFVQRAAQVRPGFALSPEIQPAVPRICRLLEGMPLGIELAAAWTRLLPCTEIAVEIAKNLDFLATTARNVPARQRSLRAAFDYSWGLLSETERRVLARLAVFRGGFTRAAAAAVCGDLKIENEELKKSSGAQSMTILNLLAALADKSLLYSLPAGRYDLHAALQQYAEEKLLAAGEHELARARHCRFYMALLEYQSEDELVARLKDVLAQVDPDIENVRAAWSWAVLHGELADIRIWLDGIFHLYEARSLFKEGMNTCERLVERLRRAQEVEAGPPGDTVLGYALTIEGWFYFLLGLFDKAHDCARESAEWLRSAASHPERASNFLLLGTLANIRKQHREVKQFLSESLAISQATGQRLARSYARIGMGIASAALGECAEARQHLLEGLSILEELGHQIGIGYCLLCLGDVARALGEHAEARRRYTESLAVRPEISGRWIMGVSHTRLGSLARTLGDYEQARQHYQESLDICRALHHPRGMAMALGNLGRVAFAQGEHAEARHLHEESLALSREIGNKRGIAISLNHLGRVSCALGANDHSRQSFGEALKVAMEIGAVPLALDALVGLAELTARAGDQVRAVEMLAVPLRHPAGEQRTKDRAGRLLTELASQLPIDVVAAAQERGQARTLVLEVRTLLEA